MATLDGFSSYEAGAKRYIVYHNHGQCDVYATSEAIALMRFAAKYPNLKVISIKCVG